MKRNITQSMLFLLLLSVSQLQAQNRFKAGLAVGLNLTQLDGDLQQGYDKPGINFGLKGFVIIKPQFDISAELFFNQKGATYSSSKALGDTKTLYSIFTFNYADVIFLANFNLNPNESETHYRHTFHTGISLGRLVNSTTSIQRGSVAQSDLEQNISKNYKSNDVSFVVGWSWYITKRMGVTLRHTLSLSDMYQNPVPIKGRDIGLAGYQSLRSYYFSAQVFYNFISPKKVGVSKNRKKKSHKDDSILEEL